MSPYKGICIHCDKTIEGKTREEFGDALIDHHQNRDKTMEGMSRRCNIFQVQEFDEEGKSVSEPFGLEATMDMVGYAWTGNIWHIRKKTKEME